MARVRHNLQVVVVADDPIEAGMLALDLVQAGVAAQAVRDRDAAVQQLRDLGKGRASVATVVVSAHRELVDSIELSRHLTAAEVAPGFVAVVLRSQRDAAERQGQELGWSGVAVRPVNAEELLGLVENASARSRPISEAVVRTGDLASEPLLDVLFSLVERMPRPGAGKSAVVHLETFGRTARVVVRDGELVHAETDGEQGRHVLERLCAWRQGAFRIEPAETTSPAIAEAPHSLTGSSLGLLAVAQEYARRVAEARQSLPYTDCVCTVRWERVRPLPVVAEALFRRIASGLVLAEAIAGEGDDELEAFAALEARIKRGAVVPQIETAPPLAPPSAAARTSGVSGAYRATSASSAFPAVPMTLVDAPQAPLPRRRNHPTTHLYRVGDDPRTAVEVTTEAGDPGPVPLVDAPPALPQRRGPTPLTQSGIAPQRGPTPLTPYTTRDGHALTSPRRTPTPGAAGSGQRTGPVTGWFGVAVGDATEFQVGELADPRGPGPARISQALTDRAGDTGDERLSARPYAWVPAAQIETEPVEPAPAPAPRPKRWPWLAAAAALVVLLGVLVWPSLPEEAPAAVQGSPGERAYRKAMAQIDAGQTAEARRALAELVQLPGIEAEALLQLGVLDAEAGDLAAARQHLEAYLAHPEARHARKAQRLFDHLFGVGGSSQAPRQAAAVGGP